MKKRCIIFLGILLLAAIGFGIYAGDYYPALGVTAPLPESVTVEISDEEMIFLPREATTGLIFYPGGKVEFTAYAPLLAKLAERNVLCVLLKMPLNLAVLDVDAAGKIPEQFPQIENWYLAGHSLGGSMAASYAAGQADIYEGLILLAAYSTADLTQSGLKVCTLYGDQDGILNFEKYQKYRNHLPDDAWEQVLEGGNHAGFGRYGHQKGDGVSALESWEQIQWTTEILLEFMKS